MALPRLLAVPGFVRWGIRIDNAPALGWLALQLVALWPTWLWLGSSGAGGLLALSGLAALAWLQWKLRRELRASPRLGWLVLAAAGTIVATSVPAGTAPVLPGLMAGAAALMAFAPTRIAGMPEAGLPALLENTFVNRVCLKSLFGAAMLLCIAGAVVA
ncbi:MAG: hypothetical protein V4757_07850 [Pseudomonadota bacterium]